MFISIPSVNWNESVLFMTLFWSFFLPSRTRSYFLPNATFSIFSFLLLFNICKYIASDRTPTFKLKFMIWQLHQWKGFLLIFYSAYYHYCKYFPLYTPIYIYIYIWFCFRHIYCNLFTLSDVNFKISNFYQRTLYYINRMNTTIK